MPRCGLAGNISAGGRREPENSRNCLNRQARFTEPQVVIGSDVDKKSFLAGSLPKLLYRTAYSAYRLFASPYRDYFHPFEDARHYRMTETKQFAHELGFTQQLFS